MEPQTPILPVSPIEPPKPKKNNLVVILLSVLLLISISVSIFFALQTQKLAKQLSQLQVQPTSIPAPSATADSTSNWKTYSNTGYSFKYPIEWDTYSLGEEGAKSTLMIAPKEKVDKVRQIPGGFGGGTFLTLTINTKSEPPVWKTDEYWQVTSEPIKVGGIDGTKYNVNVIQDLPGLSKGDKIISIVVKNNSTYIQIDLLDQTYKEIFDQILSTFRFTN